MDKNSAISLLEKTFKNEFNMDNYVDFLKELFNKSNIRPRSIEAIRKEFWSYENEVYILGDYQDDSGDSIALYAIELTKQSSRDRARTMQRNLIASLIKDRYDSALVAFYEPNLEDWRFSHVKVEYEFNENGIREKLSSPRRHSFLVGVNEPNHTCQSQFLDLLCYEDNIQLKDIEQAFSIENVTDEFFNKYKELFLQLTESLEEVKEKDPKVKSEFDDRKIESSDFAKKLMGQLVFIYFLQKKGWLGVKEYEDWGTGPKDFLRRIYDESMNKGENFFNDVLEHLFYEGFSKKELDNHFSDFGYKVPFLNGGLFEPINNYDWIETDVILDNNIFKEILDTFDQFNFTIKEDEPLEKEVAVDPEMLGKVFENLLEIIDRQSKGAFYTPRHIVHFMCQESLISYLSTNSDVSEDDLRIFITKGDLAVNSIIRANEEKKKYNGQQFTRIELPDSIKEHSNNLEKLLKKVKVIDPAVGSGAFPVGMMNEIVKARYILGLLNMVDDEDINLYKLKKETIENSLYGVDLELSATDITKLRFWLSLIVDEEDNNVINPLPNLDNQIMCGNSLVDSYKDIRLFDDTFIVKDAQQRFGATAAERIFKELEVIKKAYFEESDPEVKQDLKQKIRESKWDFIETYLKDLGKTELLNEIKHYEYDEIKPFFIWELEFSEVFQGMNSGFDIAIGNPPYVKEGRNKNAFDGVRNSPYYQGKMDLWYLFGCRALDLVKENGIVSFIATNNWVTSFGASKFRNKVNDEAKFKYFIDFGNYKAFDTASIQTMIYLMTKDSTDTNYHFKYSKLLVDTITDDHLKSFLYSDNVNELWDKFHAGFNRKMNKDSYFSFMNSEIHDIISKIQSDSSITYLTNKELSQGIVAPQEDLNGRNAKKLNNEYEVGKGIFVLNDEELSQLNLNDNELELIKPYYTTEELKRYYSSKNNKKWIIYTKSDIDNYISNYPNIKAHLDKFSSINTSSNKPYGLHRARKEEIFTNEKIIIARKCEIPTFSYANFDAYVSQTFMIINSKRFNLKFLTGLLNSKLIQFWLKYKGKMQGNNYQLDKEPLQKIPIITDVDENIERKIIMLVDNILEEYKSNTESPNIESFENKLNYLIYELYGITEDEINKIENVL
ncbi:MAG: Eco57I restriction-modification methylase domain-containing protein [Methanobrevibacter sp.]|nr:Eco57I restriction-modification methylase domain-containing protein [Methanobrevibacter sp.]